MTFRRIKHKKGVNITQTYITIKHRDLKFNSCQT